MAYVFIIFDLCHGIYRRAAPRLWPNDLSLACIPFTTGEEGVADINSSCIRYVCYRRATSLCRVDSKRSTSHAV